MREKRFPPAHTVMTTSKLRIVFMGTPDFAAKILRAVAAWEGGEVTAAYAQPDRPAGRGRRLREPDVKAAARELGIPVLQPLNFREQKADNMRKHIICIANIMRHCSAKKKNRVWLKCAHVR